MQRSVKASIRPGERLYVAECFDIPVVTQGATLDEAVANLREAVGLFWEDEDPAEYGLTENPSLLVTFEIEPAAHAG